MSATILPFRPRSQPRRRAYPPRRPQNGHYPDCPYPEREPTTCRVCASEKKGRTA